MHRDYSSRVEGRFHRWRQVRKGNCDLPARREKRQPRLERTSICDDWRRKFWISDRGLSHRSDSGLQESHRTQKAAELIFVALIFIAFVGAIALMRRSIHRKNASAPQDEKAAFRVDSENPSAFVAASMQGVIQRLREQEQELS